MAKLNVTIPAVDVVVDGVTFRKVEREAQAGDIVKVKYSATDVDSGAFYRVEADSDSDLFFRDNAGDERYRIDDDHGDSYEVYEAITAPSVEYREVKRVAVAGERIKIVNPVLASDYEKGDVFTANSVDSDGDVFFTDNAGDRECAFKREYVVLEPAAASTPQYVEVKREAAVGERIRIVNPIMAADYGMGDEFIVINAADRGGDVQFTDNAGERNTALFREYVVLAEVGAKIADEPVAEPKRLAVGDFAKVLNGGREAVGTIIKITKNDRVSACDYIYAAELLNGDAADVYGIRDLTPATPEEVSAAQRIEKEAQEIAKWAAIGRKVNEYKTGDIVLYKDGGYNGLNNYSGIITEIIGFSGASGSPQLYKPAFVNSTGGTYTRVEQLTLITPVEQRFDNVA